MDAEFKRKAEIIANEKIRNYIVKAIDEAKNARINQRDRMCEHNLKK